MRVVKTKELTPKQILSVPCTTCGAATGEAYELHTGTLRTEPAGADEGGGRATDADPDRQRILQRTWVDGLTGECRATLAGPFNVCVLADGEEQIELLGEKFVVVFEAKAEKRVGLHE